MKNKDKKLETPAKSELYSSEEIKEMLSRKTSLVCFFDEKGYQITFDQWFELNKK